MSCPIRLIIFLGILYISNNVCLSQTNNPIQDRFVIILDVQQNWTDNSLSHKASEEMLKSINKLIEQTSPDKVIYVKSPVAATTLSISFKGIKVDTIFADGFDKKLMVVNSNIFEKKEGDAFTVKELTDFLKQKNAEEIIITGLLAEKCVYKTALGGISRNYDIYIIPEAIGSKSEKSKEKIIIKLTHKGVKLLTLSDSEN
jgi:nicotinamidase-related amidase